jgi:hypothetical protein
MKALELTLVLDGLLEEAASDHPREMEPLQFLLVLQR